MEKYPLMWRKNIILYCCIRYCDLFSIYAFWCLLDVFSRWCSQIKVLLCLWIKKQRKEHSFENTKQCKPITLRGDEVNIPEYGKMPKASRQKEVWKTALLIYYHTTVCCKGMWDNFKTKSQFHRDKRRVMVRRHSGKTLNYKVQRKVIDSALLGESTYTSFMLLEFF